MRSLPLVSIVAASLLAACSSSKSGSSLQILNAVLFDTRTEVVVGGGSSPDAVLVDLDLDGRLDLAIATHAGAVELQFGRGDGTFGNPRTVDVVGRLVSIACGDLDRDGDPDLVVLRGDALQATVLRNDGGGTFTRGADLTVPENAIEVLIDDLTADGDADLVIAALGSPQLALFQGQGNGSFSPATALPLPDGASGLASATGEVTGDGWRDLIVTDASNDRVLVYPGQSSGTLGSPIAYPVGDAPVAASVGDLNGDGKVDIAVSNLGDASLSLLLQEQGGFRIERLALDGAPGRTLVGDVTGDQIADIAVCRLDQLAVSVLAGLGGGRYAEPAQLGSGGTPTRVLSGDVDGDQHADLVATGGGFARLSLWRAGTPPGLRGAVDHPAGIAAPAFVVAADFDGDGRSEVAAGGAEGTVISFLRIELDAKPFARSQVLLSVDVGRPVFNLTRGDFDRDGRIDIAVSAVGGVRILANTSTPGRLAFDLVPPNGSGVLVPAVGPFEVVAADLDLDGDDDFVIADAGAGNVLVLRALPGRFEYAATALKIAVDGMPGGLAIADFTGDGYPDIAVSRHLAGRISILRNDGAAGFIAHSEVLSGAGPIYLRTADFDEDGRDDLVVSNVNADEVRVLLSSGYGFRPLRIAAGERPTALLTRDLNRDGNADILVASLRGADFRILLGDGNGGFPRMLPFAGSYRAVSADLADVNGNGLLDLLLGSLETNRVSAYRNVSR